MRTGIREGSIAESAILTWHSANMSLGGLQGSPSGNGNHLQGNPAPSPTMHGRQDSPACTGYVATQIASVAAAVLE